MTWRSRIFILPLCTALAVSCSDDHGLGPHRWESVPIPRELTTVEIAPTTSILTPGGTQQLSIEALDQFGEPMREGVADKVTYVSSAPQIALVSSTGLVTAVGPGVASITASLTVADQKVVGSMTTWVDSDTATSVTVTASPDGTWSPNRIRVKAGSTVTWAIPDGVQVGTLWLIVSDDAAEELKFVDGVSTRTFLTRGSFSYGTGYGLMWFDEGGIIDVY